MNPLIKQSGLVAVVFASLVACSKSEPLAPELQAAVETRQQGFSDIGEAFKTIRDALQAGRSLDADMAAAAQLIADRSQQLVDWFPEGTSSEHGTGIDALPAIWLQPEAFTAARERFVSEAAELAQLANAEDAEGFAAQVGPVGMSCKGCHDDYRAD